MATRRLLFWPEFQQQMMELVHVGEIAIWPKVVSEMSFNVWENSPTLLWTVTHIAETSMRGNVILRMENID